MAALNTRIYPILHINYTSGGVKTNILLDIQFKKYIHVCIYIYIYIYRERERDFYGR